VYAILKFFYRQLLASHRFSCLACCYDCSIVFIIMLLCWAKKVNECCTLNFQLLVSSVIKRLCKMSRKNLTISRMLNFCFGMLGNSFDVRKGGSRVLCSMSSPRQD